MHQVVANELLTRYDEVTLVTADEVKIISRGAAVGLEAALAAALAAAHNGHILKSSESEEEKKGAV